MAKAAHGLADDLLTNTLLTARCPVVFAPAMHTEMWEHPATRANVATLRRAGAWSSSPQSDASPVPTPARAGCPSPKRSSPSPAACWPGAPVPQSPTWPDVPSWSSAGGTREAIDPVRFVGNRSSGRQGYALAQTAAARGAKVVLVSANVALDDPAGVDVVRVTSAADLEAAVRSAAAAADAVVMAAAVADFRPSQVAGSKIKKGADAQASIELERTADVLAGLVAARTRAQVIVGFAAETGDAEHDWLEHGRAKLASKGCDLLVVNEVGDGLGFEVADNAAVILGADGSRTDVPRGPKEDLADTVWDLVAARLT